MIDLNPWVPTNCKWGTVSVKRLFKVNKEVVGTNSDNYDRISLTLSGVVKRGKDDNEGLQPSAFDTYQIVRKNNIIFKLIDLENINTSRVGLSKYDGMTSSAYIILKNNSDDNRYEYYYFMSLYYQNIYNKLGDGGVRSSLSSNVLLNIKVINPPSYYKKKISNYLDKKCYLIDYQIDRKKKIIDKLKELMQQSIDSFVMPNEEDIDWIKTKISYEVYVRARLGWKGLTADEYVPNGYILLAIPNISDIEIDFENVNYITKERYDESPEIKISRGDVLLAKDGSTLGTVNVVRNLKYESTVNGSIAVLTPKKSLNSVYLMYYLKSSYVKSIIQKKKDGIGVPHLFQRDINKITLYLPPINKQNEISYQLDSKFSKIDKLIKGYLREIDLLLEYKKSLIYEVVTGKKEV